MRDSDRSDEDTKAASQAVWGATPAGSIHAPEHEVGTREFFEQVVARRSSYEIPWLDELIPFHQYQGRRVLEIGCGAGYDVYAFARAGALVTGIDLTPQNPVRTRRHLGFFGLEPDLAVADAERLPFADGSFDVAFSNGVLHHTPGIATAFREAHRVLAADGTFWVIVYHRDSIFHWISLVLCMWLLRLRFLHQTYRDLLSAVEATTATERPLVKVYSRGGLRRLLTESGFTVEGLWTRKLTVEDLPVLPGARHLYRLVPNRLLTALGSVAGWYLIARARR